MDSPKAETPLPSPPLSADVECSPSSSSGRLMSTSPSMEFAKINKAVVIQSSSANGQVVKSADEASESSRDKRVLRTFADYKQFEKERLLDPKRHKNIYTTSLDNMPAWYADNEFIHSGYRRITNSYAGCFLSLFYLHNETANVYSHLVGALGFILSLAAFYTFWTRAVSWHDITIMSEGVTSL